MNMAKITNLLTHSLNGFYSHGLPTLDCMHKMFVLKNNVAMFSNG